MHLHKNYFHKMELNAYRPTKTFPISSSLYLLRTALLFGYEFFRVVVVVGAFALLLHKILRFSKPIYVQYIILLPFFPPVLSVHTISYTWSRVAFFSLASHRHLSVITINRSINIYLLDYLRSFIYMQRANIRPTKYNLTFKSCHLFFRPIFILKKIVLIWFCESKRIVR